MCCREYWSVYVRDSRATVRFAGLYDQCDEHAARSGEQSRLSEAVLSNQAESGAVRRVHNGVRTAVSL